jgi:hypothetical protein
MGHRTSGVLMSETVGTVKLYARDRVATLSLLLSGGCMLQAGDIVIRSKPTIHLRWVIETLLYDDIMREYWGAYIVALDANSERVEEYNDIVPLTHLEKLEGVVL